jgi:hemolysin III
LNLGRGWQASIVPAILPIMVSNTIIPHYSALEETLNVSSHALGFALSIIALVALLLHSMPDGDILTIVSVTIFGCSLIITYAASTIYHSSRSPLRRSRLRIMDHASIYLLIAGTYTPFSLIVLQGSIGWTIFGISWVMAIVGITLKIFFTGRYRLLSTLMYLFMGWLIVFAIVPLIAKMPVMGMRWLVAGGLAYTLGAILYAIRKIPLNHAIFHIFTMVGSICHFVAVYLYVI